MRTVIAGAGSVGRSIARELLAHGHEVTLIDREPDAMRVSSVAEADWILADACSPDALDEASLETCDAVVAATGDDKANLVISLLAKTEFGVPRVVARVSNPKNEWLFTEDWGVDVAVSTPRIMTSLVEEAVSVGSPVRIFTFHQSGAAMYAVTLAPDSALVDKQVGEVRWPPHTLLVALLRDSRPIAPDRDDAFVAGDELLLLVSADGDQGGSSLADLVSPRAE